MVRLSSADRLYSTALLAVMVEALQAESISPDIALDGVGLAKADLYSPLARVSAEQLLRCYRNAARLAPDPWFAYRTGYRFHLTTFGMYGFSIMSCPDFRQALAFHRRFQELATPLVETGFLEQSGRAVWTITPIAHPLIDASLYRFLVELYFGITMSVFCDLFEPSFSACGFEVTYRPAADPEDYARTFGAEVTFGQPHNELVFDAARLDTKFKLGNRITYAHVRQLCERLLEEMHLRTGLPGEVRQFLMENLMQPISLEATAKHLKRSARTLRRDLAKYQTSYRKLVDETRMHVAIKYLRDTELTVEDIASVLRFSEPAHFRKAFRRWTGRSPVEFRRLSASVPST